MNKGRTIFIYVELNLNGKYPIIRIRSCAKQIITEETSNGNMKIINREKYHAINTEIVTAIWCRNTFPYLKSRVPASRNATMISVRKAPSTILSLIFGATVISDEFYKSINTAECLCTCIKTIFCLLRLFDFDLCIFLHLLKFFQRDWFQRDQLRFTEYVIQCICLI